MVGHSGLLWRIGVLSLLLQLFALAVPLLTGMLVDRVIPHGDEHLLSVLGVGLLIMVVFHCLASLIRSHLSARISARTSTTQMTLGFLEHLAALPYAFFQQRSEGDLMMRVNSNAQIREMLTSSALSGLLDGALASVYLVILLLASPAMAALVVRPGAATGGRLPAVLSPPSRNYMSQDLQTQAKAQSYLVQMLAGIETLKASGRRTGRWSSGRTCLSTS